MSETTILSSPANVAKQPKRKVDDALIAEITRTIVEGVNPRRVILFGSRARGDHREDSDVDIFVELESDDPSRFERWKKVSRLFMRRWWPMDLLVYTPKEVEERQNSLISIVPEIEREGRVLYRRDA